MVRERLFGRVADAATDRVLDTVDINRVLEHVDVNAVLERVDVDAVLDRVDVNAVLDRVDVQRLLDRVDVQRIVGRADAQAILDSVDLEGAVRRSGVPDIVAETTSRMAGSTISLARQQINRIDLGLSRLVARLLGRRGSLRPLQQFAGPLSRALGAMADVGLVLLTFSLGYAGLSLLLDVFVNVDLGSRESAPWAAAALLGWAFVYHAGSLTLAAATPGKWLVGTCVLCTDGRPVTAGRAAVRTVLVPLGSLTFGLTYAPIVLGRRHRAVHDLVAGTLVVLADPARDLRPLRPQPSLPDLSNSASA